VGGETSKKHRIELVDVDAMADGGRGDDVPETFAERRKRLPWSETRLRTLHDLLNFSDGDAAGDQRRHKRQVTCTLAPLVPFDLGLQRLDNLVPAFLVRDVG